MIVVTSLHRDFLPSSWSMYHGTFWDYATYYGTIGLFFSLVLPVHPVPAGDLDHRDARAGPRDERAGTGSGTGGAAVNRRGDRAMKAEHDPIGPLRADGRVRSAGGAARGDPAAYDHGYRMMEAYSPFPVDGLAEALGFQHEPDRRGRPDRRRDGRD